MANEIDKNALDLAISNQKDRCDKAFTSWGFAKTRAHKGMTMLIIGLLACILALGAVQTRWLVGMSNENSEKIHKLEIDTALQLKGLQVQQATIIKGISDLNESIRILTEKMIPE